MAHDLAEILKYASQEVLDINADLLPNIQKEGGDKISTSQKYKNKPVELDGKRFDSKAEARYYTTLQVLAERGAIRDLECQPKFTLLESFVYMGDKIRKVTYAADFRYFDVGKGKWYIVDVKSPPTAKNQLFGFKWKMLQHKYRYDHDTVLELVVT